MNDASKIRELLETYSPTPGKRFKRGYPVSESAELARIRAIPRRVLDLQDPTAARLMTQALRRHNPVCLCDGTNCEEKRCRCWVTYKERCIMHLRPVQGWTLAEAARYGSFLGLISVGEGKTGIDILAARVIRGVKNAGLLIPTALKSQFLTNFAQWSEHFETPNLVGGHTFHTDGRARLHVLTYTQISLTENTDLLSRHNFDLILGDEVQALQNPAAARTTRFLRDFVRKNPVTGQLLPRPKFSAHSGSLTSTSPQDFAHLSALALEENSPLPLGGNTLQEFVNALAELPQGNCDPGELLTLAVPGELEDLRKRLDDDTEIAREVFARRLRETPGVIVTTDARPKLDDGSEVKLSIGVRHVEIPDRPIHHEALTPYLRGKSINELRSHVEDTWERPDGEELIEVIEQWRCLRELSSGFFYRWRFPRREPIEVIDHWFAVRKAWFCEVRQFLKNPVPFGDSPAWAEQAAIRFHFGYTHEGKQYPPRTMSGPLPVLASMTFLEWLAVEKTVEPASAVVWLDHFLVDDAVEWLRENSAKGIVWYEHSAYGEEVFSRARRAGLNVAFYGGGKKASEEIAREDGSRSIIASIAAHHEGKNLQRFDRNLIANPPGDGSMWEQLLGRTHRNGQRSPIVTAQVYRHSIEYRISLDNAIAKAGYISSMGSVQRLKYAELDAKLRPLREAAKL